MKSFSLSLALLLMACSSPAPLDVQGHRGCRGLYPENSIPAFMHALELGVTTLEMDAVITKDRQVILSHEPFMSPEICRNAAGAPTDEDEARARFNIYQMTYDEVRAFDCGSKPHPRFPDQQKIPVIKPRLADVIDRVEQWRVVNGKPAVFYNIETKSTPEGDEKFHPAPEAFVKLLVGVLEEKRILDRSILQSFDVRTLQVAHQLYPDLRLALLVENEASPEAQLETLGFVPAIYSPHFELVDTTLVSFCHTRSMQLIPWTVNEADEIRRMKRLGVDGIISDYPDRVLAK
ncbi:glycerophosphoryl diester phosphodiesterase [Catalinimonas alkaloidigena]|uniref:Glycerophosphoryl diester phosphodiesterase n=1 Tax=Catalinimonas alkaloidigena TaxID=1075417 RepID=A0A1G9AQ78_9BACT|nr:glycerophosphodiester phosphodiesterase [Catalinimonas alkaloidigena]SDK29536.1 glycerophosphoryl diester phosphodiesterase [Catalinimonas alkaloidigena]